MEDGRGWKRMVEAGRDWKRLRERLGEDGRGKKMGEAGRG